ncbi:O-antigen ligase [Rhizobium sp. BK529]|uniref:O-antigen ligase family protein n=1 Tax=unclassified Rhizobium TaxID=2613769 RepID=UPI001049F3C2|nr:MULTISPECIES: O-antigen ligase family protein [unclassified Rhizobium]MBB3590162.1 O-antigen ligase [Rhizobium sp. BK529]TCS04858.1 O-antigen ligase [Rhizobium sp. BK418]
MVASEEPIATPPRLKPVLVILWLLLISAPIVESDTYRYAALLLIGTTFAFFKPNYQLLKRDWLANACVAWGTYALLRFLFGLIVYGEKGASDWLYAFPLFFPAVGIALYCSRKHIETVFAIYFPVALAALLISTDYRLILAGNDRISPLYHNNLIHGAIGCGFLTIGAFYWLLHAWETGKLARRSGSWIIAVATLVIALCLFNIYGSKAKGVWLSLVLVGPLMLASLLLYADRRRAALVGTAVVALIAAALFVGGDDIWRFAGPTYEATARIETEISAHGVWNAVADAIASKDTPESMSERLQLWANASEVIAQAPLFGAGNHWLTIWGSTTYASVPYTLLHNGYFEMLVRHGLFGIIVFSVLAVAMYRRVLAARKEKLISLSALLAYTMVTLFFLGTILSNSNNRLAIGESFFFVFSAVAFACGLMLKKGEIKQGANMIVGDQKAA